MGRLKNYSPQFTNVLPDEPIRLALHKSPNGFVSTKTPTTRNSAPNGLLESVFDPRSSLHKPNDPSIQAEVHQP